ncbi:MAG: PaaI family thioesterase [Archaeoglobaceae archaeon]
MEIQDDPFRNLLCAEVVEVRDGYAKLKARIKEEFLNFHRIAHGGFIMALLDCAFAISANTDATRFAINMSVNFISPANSGDTIYVECEKIRGRRTAFYRVRAFKNSELIAEGTAIAQSPK